MVVDDALPSAPDLRAGFTRVDDQPEPVRLVEAMEATAAWPAVRTLRGWERERLALSVGDSLLDVGCGLGDVAAALAAEVGDSGSVLALDASEAMLEVARARVGADRPIEFRVGDARALDLPDGSVDACRCERVLQWLDDPAGAIAEMTRVLRPGGRLVVTDTDWRTLALDLPDDEAASAFMAALAEFRGEGAWVGGRLLNLCRDAGLAALEVTAAGHVWSEWDVDEQLAPPGLLPIHLVAPQLVAAGLLDEEMVQRFLTDLEVAARSDRLYISVTMVAVAGRTPAG